MSLSQMAEALLAIEGALEDLPPAARVEALELALRLVRPVRSVVAPPEVSDVAGEEELDEVDHAILSALPAKTAEIAAAVQRHPTAVARRMGRLVAAGRVRRAHRKAPWMRSGGEP